MAGTGHRSPPGIETPGVNSIDADVAHDYPRLPLALLCAERGWITAEALSAAGASDAEVRALCSRGLLTDALAQRYGVPTRVRRLAHAETPVPGFGIALRRDVRISAGRRVCALASTLMPEAVLDACPWLRDLGDRALGESLAQRLPVSRGEYRFRALRGDEAGFPAPAGGGHLWARRYPFQLEAGALLVVEWFAPGVLDDLGQR